MKKYLKVWKILSLKSVQIALESRFGAIVFTLGKIMRISLMIFLIVVLISESKTLAGYDIWQVIFFYATFNLIDIVPQFFLREVYGFRSYIVSGDFDYFLIKPLNPLFRALFGGVDVLDSLMLLVALGLIFFSVGKIGDISIIGIILYLLLILNAMLIAGAFHVAVAALGVLTTEVDSALWIYRDLTYMGRFPVDIYRAPLSFVITFVAPIGVMTTFPAKALLGLITPLNIAVAFTIGFSFLTLSILFWKFSLYRYSSASS